MAAGDPTSHSLRGAIGNALQNGRPELAEQYRQELRLHNLTRAITKTLTDAPPLTGPQVRQLKALIEDYGPLAKRPEPRPVEDDAVAV